MANYPYAVANLLSTSLLFAEAIIVTLYLKETLKGFREVEVSNFDPVRISKGIWNRVGELKEKGARIAGDTAMMRRGLLSGREESSIELDRVPLNADGEFLGSNEKGQDRPPQRLPFRRIWTSNVLWTLLSIAIFDFHMG